MTDVFEKASLNILKSVNDKSKGCAILSVGDSNYMIDVVIEKDVALINEHTESRGDDAVSYADTATFESRDDLTVGSDKLVASSRTWNIGRTIEDDGYLMTVVIT